jgi:hypothetical protein
MRYVVTWSEPEGVGSGYWSEFGAGFYGLALKTFNSLKGKLCPELSLESGKEGELFGFLRRILNHRANP